ncbi:MAG: hypothetical protein KJZ73_13080 [Pseudorhodoplanes sp.]|nr:hypothetical protein [Pseudorhodoplanes sp.]
MAKNWRSYPSAMTNGVNDYDRTVVDPVESIGTPGDARATSNNSTNSAFALLKGMCTGLGLPDDSGAVVNTSQKVFGSPLTTLGDMDDAPATSPDGRWSAISLMKGLLSTGGL